MRFFYVIVIVAGLTGIVFISGCSTASSTIRYGKEKSKDKPTDYVSRYSDTTKLEAVSDSLCFDEALDDDEFEDFPGEEIKVDISEVLKKYSGNTTRITDDMGNNAEKVIMEIIKYLNTPYKYGGNSAKGIDCSAFTQTVFNNSLNISLLRSAREQYTRGGMIEERDNLKFGDLIFFDTRRRIKPGHVGIYLGDNLFAHASRKLGVTISSLNENYYSQRYMGGRRMNDSLFED
jgi:lipoprotein Spr